MDWTTGLTIKCILQWRTESEHAYSTCCVIEVALLVSLSDSFLESVEISGHMHIKQKLKFRRAILLSGNQLPAYVWAQKTETIFLHNPKTKWRKYACDLWLLLTQEKSTGYGSNFSKVRNKLNKHVNFCSTLKRHFMAVWVSPVIQTFIQGQ